MTLNPYLALWRELRGLASERDLVRKQLIWAYSWAVPDDGAIRELACLGPLVEIGAGTGYWAWQLRQAGADIVAFDGRPEAPPHWIGVARGGPEAIAAHPGRALLLCWPPLDDPMALRCAEALLEHSPASALAYVGEPEGGRTADARFFSLLKERFRLVSEREIPNWPGFRDRLFIYSAV